MKNLKLNLLFAILLCFIMIGITKSSVSGDKWKLKNVTTSNIGGEDDLEFKLSFENTAELKSLGDEFSLTVKFTAGGRVIETKTISVNPPKISKGGTFQVTVEFAKPNNFMDFEEIAIKVDNQEFNGINITGIQKTFKVK